MANHAPRRFEFQEGGSSKFWEVALDGTRLSVQFGKIGTMGQSKPKDFATEAEAEKAYQALVREKTGKGYVEVGDGGAPAAGPSAPIAPRPAPPKAAKPAPAPAPEEDDAPPTDKPWLVKPKYIQRRRGIQPVDPEVARAIGPLFERVEGLCPQDVPLYLGAATGDVGLLRQALAEGSSVHVKYGGLGTALHVAASCSQPLACEYLLAQGAYVYADRDSGHHPLTDAAAYGDRACLEVLLGYGAQIDRKACHIRPIGYAIAADRPQMVEALLDLGAKITGPTNICEYQPLCHAVMEDAIGCVAVLLRRGAPLRPSRTEPSMAMLARSWEVVRLLAEAGAPLSDPDQRGGERYNYRIEWKGTIYSDTTRISQNFYMCSDATAGCGYTPLHVAAARRLVPVVKALLAYGADPTVPDRAGNPASEAFPQFKYTAGASERAKDAEILRLLRLRGPELEEFRRVERARLQALPMNLDGRQRALPFDF